MGSRDEFARVDCLEHRAEIVPAGLRELHVALDGKPVDTFGLRDLLGAFGEWAGQVAAGQIKAQTAGQERGSVVEILEQRVLSFAGGGEDNHDMARDALKGLSQLLNTVHLVQRSVNPELAIDGVLLTMYDARLNLSRQVATEAREYFGNQVFETVIPRNVRLAEAPSFGKPIILYDVASVGAQAYVAVAKELMRRVK